MKTPTVICLLLFAAISFLSCHKEKESCTATVSLRLQNRTYEIEWMETSAGRQDRNGEIYINALGYNDEWFRMRLQNITDTGTITGISLSQLSCSDGLGFNPKEVHSGFIRLTERGPRRLSGTFEVFYPDNNITQKLVKAEGSFQVFGHD